MSKVSMTVKQILDLGLWDKVCEYKGWSLWIRNEGQIDDDEIVEFDSTFEKENKNKEIKIIYGKEYIRKNFVYCILQKLEFEYYISIYTKYLIAYRNLDTDEIIFKIKDLEEIKYILKLEEY